MNGVFNFTTFATGLMRRTEPVGRLAGARRRPGGIFDRTTDRKMCRCGRTPTLFRCRVSTTPFVRCLRSRWNIQVGDSMIRPSSRGHF
jgi:hypothetical protein